ncbi:SDR family oxidoreductase [Candidatus Pacearchaeota archaeon]|nr:SDR family oxidoreductase [Candidatus Pacearchaeota archaeon]
MELGLENKVAIITGGAAGIGKATVEVLLEEGAIPIVVDKDSDALFDFSKNKIFKSRQCIFCPYDLTRDENCHSVITQTINRFRRIDILVNNVGGNDFLPIYTTTPQRFRESLNLNLVVPYAMSFYAWTELIKSKGNIVFVGSKVSLVGECRHGGTIAYAAAKGGVNGLTMQLATTSASENLGIRVNCILPGKVNTYVKKAYPGCVEDGLRIEGRDIPFGKRITEPEEIAYNIAILASDKVSGHTTGEIIVVDGGYTKLDRNAHIPLKPDLFKSHTNL